MQALGLNYLLNGNLLLSDRAPTTGEKMSRDRHFTTQKPTPSNHEVEEEACNANLPCSNGRILKAVKGGCKWSSGRSGRAIISGARALDFDWFPQLRRQAGIISLHTNPVLAWEDGRKSDWDRALPKVAVPSGSFRLYWPACVIFPPTGKFLQLTERAAIEFYF